MHSPLDVGMLMASTVHESKNRLVHLLQAIEKLQVQLADRDDPVLKDVIASMDKDVRKLNHDLMRMLQLYSIKAGKYSLQLDSHSVAEFVEDTLDHFDQLASTRGIALEYSIDEAQVAWFDRHLLEQALSTVLFNALDFTRNWIGIDTYQTPGFLVIRVCDNGAGFNEATQAAPNSTGLGLRFAAASLAQLEKSELTGALKVFNREAGGACVELWIPD
ncbi:sensor histidine kinase [Pokkaliibacter sp. CJK22405]|uniref:sensor histidine kinase n=1 Tax=Pokkaliibacter sp. CJK22405 TaxID=3384615 RepID=UPI0039851F82